MSVEHQDLVRQAISVWSTYDVEEAYGIYGFDHVNPQHHDFDDPGGRQSW